jgi:hypothetical protein
MEQTTKKTSTILISVGDQTRVYRSVSDVPTALRKKLLESTAPPHGQTFLIADERGRREILRCLQGLPSVLESKLVGKLVGRTKPIGEEAPAAQMTWRHWAEIALLGGIGLCIWLLAVWK